MAGTLICSALQMDRFDSNDTKIPQLLRERIEQWAYTAPRIQYSQYGPMNKYLNKKFPNAMVKPQGLMRPIVERDEPGPDAGVEGEDGLDMGDVSMDSTGALSFRACSWASRQPFLAGQMVSRRDPKRYPDFIVVSYYGEEGKHDKIRIILEIGSLQDNTKAPSDTAKREIEKQLYGYMDLLGKEGEGGRWDKKALGVAMLGTEVCFSRAYPLDSVRESYSHSSSWVSLYGPRFVAEMDRMAPLLM